MSAPLTMWALDAPFDKYGVPRMGTVGRTIRRVVVMEAAEFQRMLNEHPTLKAVEFRVGAYPVESE